MLWPMHAILIILLLLLFAAIIFLPHKWLTYTFKKYSLPNDRYPGSGAQFAEHLLKRLDINDVQVEQADKKMGDHYDPLAKKIRLSEDFFKGQSLTAIVVAAHETGHAIQHHSRYPLFRLRIVLAFVAAICEKTGVILLMLMPILTLISRSPVVSIGTTVAAVLMLGIGVIVHIVTLPVEWDASFRRALPLLEAGDYLKPEDYPAARRILKAAAFTYVAGALLSLLNMSRWIAILKR